jgi:hypothetical protein
METSAILTIGLLCVWCSLCVDDKDKSDQRMLGYALGFGLLFILVCKDLYSEDECSRYEYLDDDDKRTDDQKKADDEKNNESNTMFYILVGVIVILFAVGIIFGPGGAWEKRKLERKQDTEIQPLGTAPSSVEAQQSVGSLTAVEGSAAAGEY